MYNRIHAYRSEDGLIRKWSRWEKWSTRQKRGRQRNSRVEGELDSNSLTGVESALPALDAQDLHSKGQQSKHAIEWAPLTNTDVINNDKTPPYYSYVCLLPTAD
jgi:hypothetical protein